MNVGNSMDASSNMVSQKQHGHKQNRDFMQGTNSNKNVGNSRDASSNMVRQKQHGHNLKQGLSCREPTTT